MKFVAFLRGINVGGKNSVGMPELRAAFEKVGCTNVVTVLATGNVIFDSSQSSELKEKLEEQLKASFGRNLPIILRTAPEIQHIVVQDPFANIALNDQTRLYVTFMASSGIKLPRNSANDFEVIKESPGEIYGVVQLSPNHNSTDYMKYLERHYGQAITTRSWNTVVKINSLLNT